MNSRLPCPTCKWPFQNRTCDSRSNPCVIAMELLELSWPAVKALNRDTPVVIPIAALEQHGRHMPLFTDSLLLGEVMRRVTERLKDRVLFTPLMWLGNSEHHLDFPGTMTAAPRAYLDLLQDMAENFLVHG